MCAGIQYMINKAIAEAEKAREEAEKAREEAEKARGEAEKAREEAEKAREEAEAALRRKNEEALRRIDEELWEALRKKDEEIDRLKAASKELYVNTLQSFGKSLKETVDGFTKMFNVDQTEAKETVARYWKSQTV